MSLIDTLKKQGGLQLLKKYANSGALFTALVEFIILGKDKKALEILRLSADYKTKIKLEKNMLSSWKRSILNIITTVCILEVIRFGCAGSREWTKRRNL